MSVRFVVGRAGSGKTYRCLEAIRARLRDDPVTGHRLLLIVPEQASFQMERALIETDDVPAFTRCEVLSFQRFAYRVFAETGADPRRADQTIGPLGRLMALRRLIQRERSGLSIFDRVADRPGLVKQVATALDELMREDVAPEALAELAEKADADNPLAAARLADLTRLYRAYLDYLIDDRIDPAQYLHLAAERVEACSWLAGAEVWVDGFAGFTQQEYVLLTRIAEHAETMEITLLVEPDAAGADPAVPIERIDPSGQAYALFSRTERTLVRLRRELETAGVRLDAPIQLDDRKATRFAAPELLELEQRLFRTGAAGSADRDGSTQSIRLLSFPDRRVEVEAAVAEIQRLTRETTPPMRYRDIAVIVRDLNVYHDLLSASLRAHSIPFFLDRREPTAHHPLVELVRSLLAIADDDCRLDSVRLTLKTGLLPIKPDDAHRLENYILASGIAGRQRWSEPWTCRRVFSDRREDQELTGAQRTVLDLVNDLRKQWLTAVGPWLNAASGYGEQPGRAWAEALWACLEQIDVGGQLEAWAMSAEADGRADEADAHRQVWIDFVELLDEFVRALGTESMRIEGFRETIESGLAEFDLGLAPPTLDQVLVGSIERSRHPAIRAALILGFDEGHFPLKRAEDPLLGDAEREWLEASGVEVGPSRIRQLLDERMLAYIALTRASERLWISHARTDEGGRPIQPSTYLDDVIAAVPGLSVEHQGDPRASRAPHGLTRVSDLAERLAAEFRYRPALEEDDTPRARAEWNALYDGARQRQDWRRTVSRGLAGLGYHNIAVLEAGRMEQAEASPLRASVSRLERFASCPFAHFAEYTLRLRPRVEADLGQLDLGTLCHAVLERFVMTLAEDGRSLCDLEDDEIASRVDTAAGQVMPLLAEDFLLDEARNNYLFDRGRGHLQRAVRWQRGAAKAGRFNPIAAEVPFGLSGDVSAPWELRTPKGRVVRLRGRIDRVDTAELGDDLLGLVVDYKRARDRRLDLTQVYHGLSLQLVGYMLALQHVGESLTGRPIRPAGALYLPLLEPYRSVPHPSEKATSSFKYRGIADASTLEALDEQLEPGQRSEILSAAITKSGEPHANSDLAKRDELLAVMTHVGKRMGELADALLDGDVAVEPYRLSRHMPCTWCAMRAVCRYEIETQSPRMLDSMKRKAALELIVKESANG